MSSIRTHALLLVASTLLAAGCHRSAPAPSPTAVARLSASADSAALAAGTGTLAVRVTSAVDGAPIEVAQVTLHRAVPGAQPPRDTMLLGAVTYAQGWVRLSGPAGSYRLRARRFGFVRYQGAVELRAGRTDTLVLRLPIDTTAKIGW